MNTLWGHIVKQAIDLLMHARVVRVVLLTLIGVLVYAYTWAQSNFVQQDDFSALVITIDKHIKKMDIMTAGALTRDREIQLQIAESIEENPKKIEELRVEVRKAQEYSDCLIREQPNCEFLGPRN